MPLSLPLIFLALILCTGTVSPSKSLVEPPLTVYFHAQAPPTSSLIVGSILTTSGLSASLPTAAPISAVSSNVTFYPFHYPSLLLPTCPSLVVIEGYFLLIDSFIHELRRANAHCASLRIFFWSLDPDFPAVDRIRTFDVDAVATNSEVLASQLEQGGTPVMVIPLAADPSVFVPSQTPAEPSPYLVFVGSAGGIVANTKRYLGEVLQATIRAVDVYNREHGTQVEFRIYGSGWAGLPDFKDHFRGQIPQSELPALYHDSLGVLGLTMDAQRDYGMLNNRVFEVLASGVPLLTERFEALERTFPEDPNVVYYDLDDVERSVSRAVFEVLGRDPEKRGEAGRASHETIVRDHTYEARMRDFLTLYSASLVSSPRVSKLSVLLLLPQSPVSPSLDYLLPALTDLYQVTAFTPSSVSSMDDVVGYDFVVSLGSVGSHTHDFFLANPWPRKWNTARGMPQLRGWFPPAMKEGWELGLEKADLDNYDVLYVAPRDQDRVERRVEQVGGGTHVEALSGTGAVEALAAARPEDVQAFAGELAQLTLKKLAFWVWKEGDVGTDAVESAPWGECGEDEGVLLLLPENLRGAEMEAEVGRMVERAAELRKGLFVFWGSELWKAHLLLPRSEEVWIASGNGLEDSVEWVANAIGTIAEGGRVTRRLEGGVEGGGRGGEVLGEKLRDPAAVRGSAEFAASFKMGLSRALVLGRANRELTVAPVGGAGGGELRISEHPNGIDLAVGVVDFMVGRDGGVCLMGATGADGGEALVTCLHQADIGFKLLVGEGVCKGTAKVRAELRSGVYSHGLGGGGGEEIVIVVDAINDVEFESWAWVESRYIPVWLDERFVQCA